MLRICALAELTTMRKVPFSLVLIFLVAGVQAETIETFNCQPGTPWIEGYDIVLIATIFDEKETGMIEVAGVRNQAQYEVNGVNRRWNWDYEDDSGFNYAFVLKPDGTGHFIDFSHAEVGETVDSSQSFACRRKEIEAEGARENRPETRETEPDLSKLDSDTRQSIETACVGDFTRGPAPYRKCVERQLQTIGIYRE